MIRVFVLLFFLTLTACNDSPEPVRPPANVVVRVFPNPAQERIFIVLAESGSPYSVSVLNPKGKEIYNQDVPPSAIDSSIEVNVNDEDPGFFFVVVKNGEQTYTTKILRL
jgi:hypothetical protein